MEGPLSIISLVLTVAGTLYSAKSKQADDTAAQATALSMSRDEFTREITSDYKQLTHQVDQIKDLINILKELEHRITSILSDYTSLLNQISIVSTLMLGVASSIFGALLGNTEDQPMWKVNMYVVSCVFTICFSILSIVESFFLSIHIYAEESKFISGLYPQRQTGAKIFNLTMLKGLSKSYSASIVTFFLSFLFFASTILSVVYMGLGKSNFIIGQDERLYTTNSERFVQIGNKTLTDIEPQYQSVAVLMTLVVIIAYMTIITLFVTKYRKYVLWPRYILHCCGIQKESLKQPMVATAGEFERVQSKLHEQFNRWEMMFRLFTNKYDEIYDKKHWRNIDPETLRSDSTDWVYNDVEYELYIYLSLKEQVIIQRKSLIQMRLLQLTNKNVREEIYGTNLKNASIDGTKNIEMVNIGSIVESKTYRDNYYKIPQNIKF